jgi:GR25 family glycosyltransferase involved in LPS biosynthesis
VIPIYVISLKSDSERRLKISSIFYNLNLKFEFIDAVYGKDLTQEDCSKLGLDEYFLRKNKKPLLGELGCSLSHQHVYRKIIDNVKCDWAYIFEDDAIIDYSFLSFFESFNKAILNNVIPDNVLFMLGGQDGLWTKDFIVFSKRKKIILGDHVLKKTLDSAPYIYRTCSYVINKKIANKLIELFSAQFFVADEWMYFSEKKIFNDIYYIDLIRHPIDLSASHIETDRIERDKKTTVRISLFSKVKGFFRLWTLKMFILKWFRHLAFFFD